MEGERLKVEKEEGNLKVMYFSVSKSRHNYQFSNSKFKKNSFVRITSKNVTSFKIFTFKHEPLHRFTLEN